MVPALECRGEVRPVGGAPRPYDLSRIWVRHSDGGFITVPWTHTPMVRAPFAELTWRQAHRIAASRGIDVRNETALARLVDELLHRTATGRRRSTARRPGLPPATIPPRPFLCIYIPRRIRRRTRPSVHPAPTALEPTMTSGG
jgi:hypothetical protein